MLVRNDSAVMSPEERCKAQIVNFVGPSGTVSQVRATALLRADTSDLIAGKAV